MTSPTKPPVVCARETITVGEAVAIQAPAEAPPYSVVFEDDGEAGYLYGMDNSHKANPIVDALHIYTVEQVVDRQNPCLLEVIWSGDNKVAVLFLNRRPHAAFDFGARRGTCRTGFPPPRGDWTTHDHSWDEAVVDKLGISRK